MLRVLAQSSAQPNGLRRKARRGVACVCTLYGRSRDSSVLLGIMCHAACGSSLLIFTDRFPFWCFSLPSISWFCKPSPARGLEDHGVELPARCFCAGSGWESDRASPPRVQGDDINSAATGRGGADRARSGFIIVAIGEGDTPVPNTWPNTEHYRRVRRRPESGPAPAGSNTAPAVNVLKSVTLAPAYTDRRGLGRYRYLYNGR